MNCTKPVLITLEYYCIYLFKSIKEDGYYFNMMWYRNGRVYVDRTWTFALDFDENIGTLFSEKIER